MRIKVIGSGSSGNCYQVSDGYTTILLDCGLPVDRIKTALQHNLSAVDACLLTHEHGDHSKAAKDLTRFGIPVYSSKGTYERIALEGFYFKPVKAEVQFRVNTFDVLPLEAQHDAQEPLSFYVSSQVTGEKLLYLTDTFYCKYKIKGMTHLLIEINYVKEILRQNFANGEISYANRLWSSHMSLETAVEFLKSQDLSALKEVYVVHLSNANSDEHLIKKTVQAITGVPVTIC